MKRPGRAISGKSDPEQISKVDDFGDKDLLQHIDLARILFGEVIPPHREARRPPIEADG
jgi:hypothetical protein